MQAWSDVLSAQQERDRGSSRRIPFQRFVDGAAQCGRAIQVQQFEQLRGLTARRLSLREGKVEKRFAFRRGQCQTTSGSGVEGFAFRLQHRFLMSRIQHQLMTVVSALMAGDLRSAFEDSHAGIGGDQRQLTADRFRRDRVIVEIEADIDGLARPHRQNEIRRERMRAGGSRRGCSSAKTSATVRCRLRASFADAPPDRARAKPAGCIRRAW